jgi:hypothetical protein
VKVVEKAQTASAAYRPHPRAHRQVHRGSNPLSSTRKSARAASVSLACFPDEFGKLVDMEHAVPRATLLAEPRVPVPRTLAARMFMRLNGGEDHLYTEKIAREAKAHGAQLIFVYLPMFEGPPTISDLDFLKQYGLVMNNGDLAPRDELFENWSHLNHAGAMTASGRLADAIDRLDL